MGCKKYDDSGFYWSKFVDHIDMEWFQIVFPSDREFMWWVMSVSMPVCHYDLFDYVT